MRGDWLVTIGVLVVVAVVYALTWRSARERLARDAMRRILSVPAREIMSRPPATIGPDATVAEAAARMLDGDIGCLPVVEGGRLVGLVTESDLSGTRPFLLARDPSTSPGRTVDREAVARRPVREVMTVRVVTARPDEPAGALAARMIERGIHHLPVVEHGAPVGILARRDLLRLLVAPAG